MPDHLVEVGCNPHAARPWETKIDGIVSASHRTQKEAVSHALQLAKSLGSAYRLYSKTGTDVATGYYEKPQELDKYAEDIPAENVVAETVTPTKIDSNSLGVVDQVRLASQRGNRLATFLGSLLGGFVPLATYVVSHQELDFTLPIWTQPKALLALGGLLYSAITVYRWGRMAFDGAVRALGFTVLLEGVMVFSSVGWLSHAALVYLIAINAISTGVTLALGQGNKDEWWMK